MKALTYISFILLLLPLMDLRNMMENVAPGV